MFYLILRPPPAKLKWHFGNFVLLHCKMINGKTKHSSWTVTNFNSVKNFTWYELSIVYSFALTILAPFSSFWFIDPGRGHHSFQDEKCEKIICHVDYDGDIQMLRTQHLSLGNLPIFWTILIRRMLSRSPFRNWPIPFCEDSTSFNNWITELYFVQFFFAACDEVLL